MSDSLVDTVAEHISRDPATLASLPLPLPLAQRIFLALPADARGRSSCVCRAWRDVLAEPSLWTRLDMSGLRFANDAEQQRFFAVVWGAAGRARGRLLQLDLSQQDVARNNLLPVLTANADSLRELHLHTCHADNYNEDLSPTFESVVAAAPLLQVLTAEIVYCTWKEAPRVLRAEPPFAPLQVHHALNVFFDSDEDGIIHGDMERFGPFAAALADATLQPALMRLSIWYADTAQPALMGALVDAAVARRLRELTLLHCSSAALLARLLAEGSLAYVEVTQPADQTDDGNAPLFDAAGAARVADALRVNKTLTKLVLNGARLCLDMDAAGAILGALVGHTSLRELWVTHDSATTAEDRIALGSALAALIAADAPALQAFDCSDNRLGDAGMAPIVGALPLNRHLRELNLQFNGMSEAFARERLLPAVRANATLREFKCINGGDVEPAPALAEAEELVCLRVLQN